MGATKQLERPGGSLTREQKHLVLRVTGLAESVAYEHMKTYGTGGLLYADLVQLAHLGIFRAAQLFNEDKGVPFASWAAFKAACAVHDGVRKSLRLRDPVDSCRLRAGHELLATRLAPPEHDPWRSDEAVLEQLVDICKDQLGAELTGAVSALDGLTVEERTVAKLDWGQAYAWLEQLLDEVEPAYRRIFARCHAEDMTLQAAIEAEGINYWAALRELSRLFKRLRARLEGLGLKQLPPGHGEWGRDVLSRAAAAWGEGQ